VSLYGLRWRWMTHRRSLGRSTGTRMSRAMACALTVEGIVWSVALWWGLNYALRVTR
jgi:hypothetical protein